MRCGCARLRHERFQQRDALQLACTRNVTPRVSCRIGYGETLPRAGPLWRHVATTVHTGSPARSSGGQWSSDTALKLRHGAQRRGRTLAVCTRCSCAAQRTPPRSPNSPKDISHFYGATLDIGSRCGSGERSKLTCEASDTSDLWPAPRQLQAQMCRDKAKADATSLIKLNSRTPWHGGPTCAHASLWTRAGVPPVLLLPESCMRPTLWHCCHWQQLPMWRCDDKRDAGKCLQRACAHVHAVSGTTVVLASSYAWGRARAPTGRLAIAGHACSIKTPDG